MGSLLQPGWALGEGPIAQGLSNVPGGSLQPAEYSGRLNVSSCSGDEGEGVVSKGPSKEGNGVERGDIVETLLFPAGV